MLNFKQECKSQAFKPFTCDLFLAFWRAEGMQHGQSTVDKEAKLKRQTEVLGNFGLTLNLYIGNGSDTFLNSIWNYHDFFPDPHDFFPCFLRGL